MFDLVLARAQVNPPRQLCFAIRCSPTSSIVFHPGENFRQNGTTLLNEFRTFGT